MTPHWRQNLKSVIGQKLVEFDHKYDVKILKSVWHQEKDIKKTSYLRRRKISYAGKISDQLNIIGGIAE